VYCPECGYPQSEAHRYCARCGAMLPVEGSGDTTGPFAVPEAAPEGAPPMPRVAGPALAVRAGGGISGVVMALGADQQSIGRDPGCDLFLDDVTVSRRHATIAMEGMTAVLEDLGSLNGTYVNRRRIDAPERLADGDEVQIGKFRLAFIA